MNQRPQSLKVQKALTGILHYKSAEGLTPVTVSGYERDLKFWIEYQGKVICIFTISVSVNTGKPYLYQSYNCKIMA
jgi:hypothetical protein